MNRFKLYETYLKEKDLERIVQLPQFRDLLDEMGYVLVSSPEDHRNLDFTFAFPAVYVTGNVENLQFESAFEDEESKDYLSRGFTIWKNRQEVVEIGELSFPHRDLSDTETASNTLLGWKGMLTALKGKMKDLQKEYESEGAVLLITQEERHTVRGKAKGKFFDF